MRISKMARVGLAASAAALALAACGAGPRGALTVASAVARSGRLVQHVELSGVLAPRRTSSVSSRISGAALTVTGDIGARVRAGQTLIVMDTRELEAQLAVAEAAVQVVQDQAAQSRLGIDTARDNLDLAQKSYDRAAVLIRTQAVTQGQLDDAQTKLRLAQTAYENATQQYHTLNVSSLAQAQAQVSLVRAEVSHGVISSPLDGVVTNRNVNPGDTVIAASTLMTIADTTTLELQGNVAQSVAVLLREGTRATVRVDGMRQGDYEGLVTQVGPVAAAAGQFFPVIVSVRNDGRLMAGMTAMASLDLQGTDALLIPRTAIARDAGGAHVFVLSGGRAQRRIVSLGLESADTVEVLQGLAGGDRVAVSGVAALQDGSAVTTDGSR